MSEQNGRQEPLQGIDISVFQGTPDFDRVKAAGVQFVIARAGYGQRGMDAQFERTASACNRLSLPLGAYWVCYALSEEDAVLEARQCLRAVEPYRLEYPVFYDFEDDSVRYAKQEGVDMTGALATRLITAFCAEIERAGYYAMYYTNHSYATSFLDMAALSRFDLWYAWYNQTLDRENVGIWQYSNQGRVDGIVTTVDLDRSFRDYPKIIREAGLNHLTGEQPVDGYPAGTPEWQKQGFETLVREKIIDTPQYWLRRFDKAITVGETMGVLGKMAP